MPLPLPLPVAAGTYSPLPLPLSLSLTRSRTRHTSSLSSSSPSYPSASHIPITPHSTYPRVHGDYPFGLSTRTMSYPSSFPSPNVSKYDRSPSYSTPSLEATPLTPSSRHHGFSTSPSTGTTASSSLTGSTELIFFPHPDLLSSPKNEGMGDEQDWFASFPLSPPLTCEKPERLMLRTTVPWSAPTRAPARRLEYEEDTGHDRHHPSYFPSSDNVGGCGPPAKSFVDLSSVERLPDEPFYPSSPPGRSESMANHSIGSRGQKAIPGENLNSPFPVVTPSTEAYLPQSTRMNRNRAQSKLANNADHKKPFGHTFLAPSPIIEVNTKKSVASPTPLLPIGFTTANSPTRSVLYPTSGLGLSLLPDELSEELEVQKRSGSSCDSVRLSPGRMLGRTDTQTLHSLPLQAPLNIPSNRHLGHIRRDSSDSQKTIRPGNGSVSFESDASPIPATGISSITDSGALTERSSARRPPNNRLASYASPRKLRTSEVREGRSRASSVSAMSPSQVGSPLARPSSPLARTMLSADADNGVTRAFQRDAHEYSNGRQIGQPPLRSPRPYQPNDYFAPRPQRFQRSQTQTSRFNRPISPSLPGDLLSPHLTPNEHSHQTLSSPPLRPKSPTTARESLKIVLARSTYEPALEDDEEGSLDRLVRVAQRAEHGSFPLYRQCPHPHAAGVESLILSPPHSPQSGRHEHHHTPDEASSSTSTPIKATLRVKKGFNLLSLFPPSPPPTSPSFEPDSNLGAPSPTSSQGCLPSPPLSSRLGHLREEEKFDVDKLSERLRSERGRISFAELEGMGQPFAQPESRFRRGDGSEPFILDKSEQEYGEDQEGTMSVLDAGMVPINMSKGKKEKRRPGSGRRWTLPF